MDRFGKKYHLWILAGSVSNPSNFKCQASEGVFERKSLMEK